MEQRKCLGIYISDSRAVGVLVSGHGTHLKVLACRTVQAEPEEVDGQSLAGQIVRDIQADRHSFDEVSVALDCSMFTQHNLHSEFSDYKQIANTIRFDAEEAVAMDANELAVSFNITSTDKTGAEVTVYTANREMMTEILTSMLKQSIDPTAMEPDIVCLSRVIRNSPSLFSETGTLNVVIGEKSCYIIMPAKGHNEPKVRSFLVNPSQDLTNILVREIPITTASLSNDEPIKSITISGNAQNINTEELSAKTGMEVNIAGLAAEADVELEDDVSECDFAIAYGAAQAELTRTHKTDFRNDFMPYEGRIRAMRKSLRLISIAITLMLIAVAGYFQYQTVTAQKQVKGLKEKLLVNESEVIFGRAHTTKENFATRLKRELTKVKGGKTGSSVSDDSSIISKLSYLFEAINNSSANNQLKINKISISEKTIKFDGSTRSRSYTNELFKKIDAHPKLRKGTSQVKTKVNEDNFTISIELE